MKKNKRSRKKRNNFKSLFIIFVLIVLVVLCYIIFNKFITPTWEKQKKEPSISEESIYQEEKKEPEHIAEEMIEVNLYFADQEEMYLVTEKRKIAKSPNLAKQVVIELIKGPTSSNLYSTIPEGTSINEVYVVDDIVYLDLSESISKNHPGGSSSELMTIYSLVNTLTEISPIKGVQLLIDGDQKTSLAGHVDISMPLLRDEDWIRRRP